MARAAEPHRRDLSADCRHLWPVRGVPALSGPVVYVAVGFGRVQYVGQTRDLLSRRIARHLREPAKAQSWAYVAAIALSENVPLLVVDALEAKARRLLDPQMGSAWPRERGVPQR